MKIEIFNIETASGRLYFSELPFLSKDEIEEFNTIGYTGKNSNGEITTFEEYLNSLKKGQFKVKQTEYDNGSFKEGYAIVMVTEDKVSSIEFNVEPYDEILTDIDISPELRKRILTKQNVTKMEISWLNEFSDIHEKWRKLNLDKIDMEKVRSLEERLNAIEPQIREFSPEEGDWGNINLKRGVLKDIGFMKCFFKMCEE